MDDLNPSLRALAVRLALEGSGSLDRDTTMSPSPQSAVIHDDPGGANLDLTEFLAMPLDRFMREGQLLEVRVPWSADRAGPWGQARCRA